MGRLNIMAYEHIKVSDIIESTQGVKERVANSEFTKNPPDPKVADISRVKRYDTIPVHGGLYEFMEQLRKEIPSIQFGTHRGVRGIDHNIATDPDSNYFNVRVVCEMYAYLPDDVYALGKIGFSDYCTTRAKDGVMRTPSYMVSAFRVENTKYDEYREQYRMLMSKNLSTAVSNAKKYLRQYSPQNLVAVVSNKVSDSLGMYLYRKKRASDEARNKLGSESVVKELKNMVASGYTFLHSEVEEYIKTAITMYDDYEQHRNKKVAGNFVSVSNQLGVQMFDVIRVEDATYLDKIKSQITMDGTAIRYRGDEMPEDLMGRVAVLSMAQSEDYIEGVGNRLGDTIFWVQDEA